MNKEKATDKATDKAWEHIVELACEEEGYTMNQKILRAFDAFKKEDILEWVYSNFPNISDEEGERIYYRIIKLMDNFTPINAYDEAIKIMEVAQ